jgi:hypothetical protein
VAFNAGFTVEVNPGGSDTLNGGGFDPTATFATDLAATSGTTTAPVVTSASYNFTSSDVNAYLFVKSGTNWVPGFYKIVSVASNAATLDAAIGHVVLYGGPTQLNTVAGCATTASPTTGTWGVDYSRGTSARITFTDMVVGGTNTQFTSAGNPVGPNFVGNFIQITSGTGFTLQTVEVLSVSGTTATVDKTFGGTSLSGGHGGLGGAVATPGFAGSLVNTLNSAAYMAVLGNATYSFTSSSNVAGGRVTINQQGSTIYGYTTTRIPNNLDANRPVFQSNANSISLITVGGASCGCYNIDFENGNANTAVTAYNSGGGSSDVLWRCTFNGLAVAAILSGGASRVRYCWINACTTASPFQGSTNAQTWVADCVFTGNSNLSFNMGGFVDRCVFYNNSIPSGYIITLATRVSGCLFHTTTGSGSGCIGTSVYQVENCIFWNNAGSGGTCVAGVNDPAFQVLNCAFGSNTLDVTATYGAKVVNKLTLTGDPCVSASTGNFALNGTAGAGAALKGLGFPTTLANGLTVNGLDVGAVQSVSAAAGGPVAANMTGGFING